MRLDKGPEGRMSGSRDAVDALATVDAKVDALKPEPHQLKPASRQPLDSISNMGIKGCDAPRQVDAIDAPPVVLIAEAVELAGVSKQALHTRLSRAGVLQNRICTSGPNKGRTEKVVATSDLFRLYPQAQEEHARRQRVAEIKARLSVPPPPVVAPVQDAQTMGSLKDWQRQRATARAAILREIDRRKDVLEEEDMERRGSLIPHGMKDRAIAEFVRDATQGQLDETLMRFLSQANARGGQSGTRTVSRRTIQRWGDEAKKGLEHLAPKVFEAPEPLWARPLLDLWRQPQKPSLSLVVEQLLPPALPPGVKPPSIHAARRWMNKVGEIEKLKGRKLPRELKSSLPFIRRTFNELLPLDVVSADGHTFDAEVQHPHTGRPFRPEITTIVDIATRRVIGWSVGLSESALVVVDAFRHAVVTHGVPAIFYTDNGSGYVNAQVQELLSRVGTTHLTSIPYSSQSRGVIERLQKTLWVEMAAKRLPTYIGKDMDRQAKQIIYKKTRKEADSPALLPWDTFVAFVNGVVAGYNARPHSTLGKIRDEATGRLRNKTPDEIQMAFQDGGWTPVATLENLTDFMPRELRTVARGEISLFSRTYFSRELEEWQGQKVRVIYDVRDASRVWIHSQEGTFICEAGFEANARHYMPTPLLDRAHQKRINSQVKRLDDKKLRLTTEHQPEPIEIREITPQTLEASEAMLRKLGVSGALEQEEEPVQEPEAPADPGTRPAFRDAKEYALWILNHPEEADPSELDEIQQRLKKDPLYRIWLDQDQEDTASA